MPPFAHFLFGYSITLLIILIFLYSAGGGRFEYKPGSFKWYILLCTFGGLFATLPDIDNFVSNLYIHQQWWANLCMFHITLDYHLVVSDFWFSVEMVVWFVTLNYYTILFVVDPIRCLRKIVSRAKKSEGFRYLT